jgi:flagellar protein FliO/FliZ
MPWDTYLRFAIALVLVLGLIGLAAWLARRYGMGGRIAGKGLKRGRRLAITEVSPVDPKRRLVLGRRYESSAA